MTIGCPVPVIQEPSEFEALLLFFRQLKPRHILEIGSLYGGTLWHWIRNSKPGASIVSVDKLANNEYHQLGDILEARKLWDGWAETGKVTLHKITGNSNDMELVDWVREYAPFDFIFVDGGHDYKTVNRDYELYYPMLREGGLMSFHDIALPDENKHHIEVGRWWRENKEHFPCQVIESNAMALKWGIGILKK